MKKNPYLPVVAIVFALIVAALAYQLYWEKHHTVTVTIPAAGR
jgi:hypothetical protein